MARTARKKKMRSKGQSRPNPAPKKAKKKKSRAKRAGVMKGSIKSVKGAGGYFGDFGAGLGRDAGNWVSKIFGFGDYNIKQNSLMSSGSGPPVFGSGSTEIKHREYLQDITSSTGFNIQGFSINPGLEGTFPWLSIIAQNFEVYELLGLVFEYKATSAIAVNSTNTALGTVILSTEYDSINPPFASKQEMEAHEFTVATSPAESVIHGVECAPRMGVLDKAYLRSSTPPEGTDIRMYDKGTFYIATQGMQAASVIGELWVSYHVRLLQPQLVYQPSALGYLHLRSTENTGAAFAPPVTALGGALPYTLTSDGTGIVLDEGQYFINQTQYGLAGSVAIALPISLSSGTEFLTIFTDQTGASVHNYIYMVNASPNQGSQSAMVLVPPQGGTITFNNGGGLNWNDTFIIQVPIGVSYSSLTLRQRLEKLEKLLSSNTLCITTEEVKDSKPSPLVRRVLK